MIRDFFLPQMDQYPTLTDEVLEHVEFKTVWSGKRMEVGDKVLYALVFIQNTDDLKMITFLERELNEVDRRFNYVRYENETIPVLSFKEDKKIRD